MFNSYFYQAGRRTALPIIILLFLFTISGCAADPRPPAKMTVGATKIIHMVEADLDFVTRIDTGARTTSIHALEIKIDKPATRSYEMTESGYLGADIVLDKGPLILELNARSGLVIQVANNNGLVSRVEQVEAELKKCQRTPSERVLFSMQNCAL